MNKNNLLIIVVGVLLIIVVAAGAILLNRQNTITNNSTDNNSNAQLQTTTPDPDISTDPEKIRGKFESEINFEVDSAVSNIDYLLTQINPDLDFSDLENIDY